MNELEHLKSMWAPKTKRNTTLIVPKVTYEAGVGSLNNEHWVFNVPYAFRNALDISYEERKKDKKPYMVWTQGPIISFKEGDVLHSRNGDRAVQVRSAKAMDWDESKNEMFHGLVNCLEYKIAEDDISKTATYACTQMQFVQLLIQGRYDEKPPAEGSPQLF